jgi:mono/diheme cytochrome c family protein
MQSRALKASIASVLAVLVLGTFGAQAATGPFAKDQVDSGHKEFQDSCSSCHANNLSGATAPALAGKRFLDQWASQSSADLYTFIRKTMPECQGGILSNSAYADLVAYLLWANGTDPGKDSFDGSAAVNIGAITGAVRPEVSQAK